MSHSPIRLELHKAMSLSRCSSKIRLLSLSSAGSESPQDEQKQQQEQTPGVASRVMARLLSWRSSKSAAHLKTTSLLDLKRQQGTSLPVERELDDKAAAFLELPRRQSSASINIPLKKCASERLPLRRAPTSRRRHFSSGDGEHANRKTESSSKRPQAAWRKRQQQCANCAQVFFRSMPDMLAADMAAYCSLDCKTSHGYMRSVHVAVDSQLSSLVDTWVDDGSANSSSSSASTCTSIQEVDETVKMRGKSE